MRKPTKLKALGDIADIRTGFTFREKVEEVSVGGNAHVAQIKDVRSAWETTHTARLHAHQLPMIKWEGKDKAFASLGTVLLPSRGSKGGYFRASCLVPDQSSELPVVVSSQFLVITPKQGILPEFLCWSLNRPEMQHWISEGAGSQGTSLVMLNAKLAKELELAIPDLSTQQKILHLNELWEKEQQLTQALLSNRETMLQGMFQHLLMEKSS
ncbi:restriction endonuclease subunit S [Denitrificimonas sp. JX-1]|uniref:Restriction endonuclease subunit S n=1 Tax=Denitrificimonas halotolerans TaxID=3098930 RepID=A0ABU5GUV6_9GAMM|nr:restriction endonuclease subunit S [Denitrificimonas sp. JX-1]MDY7220292.1 restriction endonuclease subunit S [Denitrificimonas sp. JX-1]